MSAMNYNHSECSGDSKADNRTHYCYEVLPESFDEIIPEGYQSECCSQSCEEESNDSSRSKYHHDNTIVSSSQSPPTFVEQSETYIASQEDSCCSSTDDTHIVETDWTAGKTFRVNITGDVDVVFEEDYKKGNHGRIVPLDPSEQYCGITAYLECIIGERPLSLYNDDTYYFGGQSSVKPCDLIDEIFSDCDVSEYYKIRSYNLDDVEPVYVVPRKQAVKGLKFIDLRRYRKFKVTVDLIGSAPQKQKKLYSKKLVNKLVSK